MAVMPTPAQNLKGAEGPIAKASEGEAVVYLPRTIGNTGMAVMPTPAQNLKEAEGPIAKASESRRIPTANLGEHRRWPSCQHRPKT
jgi:hypothetical protein